MIWNHESSNKTSMQPCYDDDPKVAKTEKIEKVSERLWWLGEARFKEVVVSSSEHTWPQASLFVETAYHKHCPRQQLCWPWTCIPSEYQKLVLVVLRLGMVMALLISMSVVGDFHHHHKQRSFVGVSAFLTPTTLRVRQGTVPLPSSLLQATLSWSGDAQASIEIPSDASYWEQESHPQSLLDWLNDPAASDLALLGTMNVTVRKHSDRNSTVFECRQPKIEFLGLELQPIFINQIERQKEVHPNEAVQTTVSVTILDARTEIPTSSIANRGVQKIMEKSQFQGRSVVTAFTTSTHQNNDECMLILSVDLTLTLTVDLPPFLPLPPGFNGIGSTIMRRTGAVRSQQLLEDLKHHYRKWKNNNVEKMKERD